MSRRVAAAAAGFVAASFGILAGPARAAGPAVPPEQALVVLLHDQVARTAPYAKAPRIESVAARRPLTRVRTVLPVIGAANEESAWVRVRLPGRPNGRKGWIRTEGTRPTATEWHITLRLSTRRVTAYRDGAVARRFRAVIGAPSTPTPRGRFFVEEAVALPGQHGGPFALATSARSNVLQEFEGGPGQIALHGTAGLAGAPGSAASHGCIRLSTRAITWLARRIGGGVPLTVTR
jgi:lipoprotein-anchoring transpeptidase ErfK/SrfK